MQSLDGRFYFVNNIGVSENKIMTKVFWNVLKLSPVILGATLLLANRTQAAETPVVTLAPNTSAAVAGSRGDLDVNTTLSDRARLNFDTSFFGTDTLRNRLTAFTPGATGDTGTNMTRLGFDENTADNNTLIERLWYGIVISGGNGSFFANQPFGNVATSLNQYRAKDFYIRGIDKVKLGDYRGAIADFNQSLQLNPKNAAAYTSRGAGHLKLGDLQKAIEDFNQALQLNPKDVAAYSNRGAAYVELGDLQKAIADYNQVLQLNPKYAEAYGNRGTAHAKLGDLQKAIEDFNQALQLNPKDAAAYYNRGTAHLALGDFQKAIADYNQVLQLNPKYAEAYGNRGFAHFKLGDKQGAVEDLRKAAQLFQAQGNINSYQSALKNLQRIQQ